MPKLKNQKLKMPTEFSSDPRGLVIAYIGAGKGKTTAAMGMAARASGAGMHVHILQFVKAKKETGNHTEKGEWPLSSEIDFFNAVEYPYEVGTISNEQMGLGFVGILGDEKQKAEHVREAIRGLERARELILSGKYQLLVLDELISALEVKLIEERDIVDLIKLKPPLMHLVLTGHNKYPKILALCDLVTEMKMIKHPYYKGVLAQRGIDY